MRILRRLLEQWRRPTGWLGRLVVRAMNVSHSGVAGWALTHVVVGTRDAVLDVGCGDARQAHGRWWATGAA